MDGDDSSLVERTGDRRRRPTSLLGAILGPGRRATFRRFGEGTNQYIDRLRARTVYLVIFIMAACGLDALFTLVHLDQGAVEANPFMAMALDRGETLFIVVKIVITVVGVWLLAAHQNFRLGLRGLYLVAGGYLLLLAYHLSLFVS